MTAKNHKKNKASVPGMSSCRSGDESLPCCAILESMTDGVFTVNLDRRINTFFKTARQLGLSRSTLWRKIKKRKLSRNH